MALRSSCGVTRIDHQQMAKIARSASELCRSLSNAEPTELVLQRLERELLDEDMIRRIRLDLYHDGTSSPSSQALVVNQSTQDLNHVQQTATSLGLSYGSCLTLWTQFVKQRHSASTSEPDLDALLKFFFQERAELLLLVSAMLLTSGDAMSPYCSIARKVVSKCGDLFGQILNLYQHLWKLEIPTPLTHSPELSQIWADGIMEQQAMLLQLIKGYMFAFKSSPTEAQTSQLLELFIVHELRSNWPRYTLLSADGRRFSRCASAIWFQIFTHILDLRKMVAAVDAESAADVPKIGEPLDLDCKLFSNFSSLAPDQGPLLLSWSAYLCLTYQLNEIFHKKGIITNIEKVSGPQKRVLRYLSYAVHLDAFSKLHDMLKLLDSHPHFEPSAVLSRDTFHDLLSSLCMSKAINILAELPKFLEGYMLPLYSTLLEHHPDLAERLWFEINHRQGGKLSSFPLFDEAFNRFSAAFNVQDRNNKIIHDFSETAMFLRLLQVMATSPSCVYPALDALDSISSSDFRHGWCFTFLQTLFFEAVSSALPSASSFILEFSRLALQLVSLSNEELKECPITDRLAEAVLLLLSSAKVGEVWTESTLPPLIESLLGLLCYSPVFDVGFSRRLHRYAVADQSHSFLYSIDIPSGRFSCTVQVIKLLERILIRSELALQFPVDDYIPFCIRLIDFICNDVFTVYNSWRFQDVQSRSALGESVSRLLVTLLSSDDLESQLTLCGQVGHRVALRMCQEPAMQHAAIQPIVSSHDQLEFTVASRTKTVVSGWMNYAFQVFQLALSIMMKCQSNISLGDAWFDLCFRQGLESSRILQSVASYIDLPEYIWSKHALVTLTKIVQLSSYNTQGGATVAALLGQAKVHDVRVQCCRFLELDIPMLKNCVLDLITNSLQYQPGLAERLFECTLQRNEASPGNIIVPLKNYINQELRMTNMFEQILCMLSHLWTSAVEYRSISSIVDGVVETWGDSLWVAVTAVLTTALPVDGIQTRLHATRSRSYAFRILSTELESSKCNVSEDLLGSVLNCTDIWLKEMLPSAEEWADFHPEYRSSLIICIMNWKLFLESVLLHRPKFLKPDVLRNHQQNLISKSLQLEGIPLQVTKDASQLLLAVFYHSDGPLAPDSLSELLKSLRLHSNLYSTCSRLPSASGLAAELNAYATVCDCILSVFSLELVRNPQFDGCDSVLGIACELVPFDSKSYVCRHLPVLVQRSQLQDPQPVSAVIAWLMNQFLTACKSEELARVKIMLMFVMAVASHPRGSQIVVDLGFLSCVSNSWFRSVLNLNDASKRLHDIWYLVMDISHALAAALAESTALQRQITEFVVVFRRQLLCSLRLPLFMPNLQELQRCLSIIYEIGLHPGRFRNIPGDILVEQRRHVCQFAVSLAHVLCSGPYATSQNFEAEQWLTLRLLCNAIGFVQTQKAYNSGDLFSFDISSRAEPESGPPPLTFLVDLIDYSSSQLHRDQSLDALFLHERRVEFDHCQRFILENCIWILLDMVQFHLQQSGTSSPYLLEYGQEMCRIERTLRNFDPTLDGPFFEAVFASIHELQRQVRQLRKLTGASDMVDNHSREPNTTRNMILLSYARRSSVSRYS